MSSLKVMTWNVLFKEKIGNVIEFVKSVDPDILGCQELTVDCEYNDGIDTAEALAKELKYNHYSGARNFGGGDEENFKIGNGIFSKYPLGKSRVVEVNSGGNPNTGAPEEKRVYIESEIDIDGKTLVFATTHLSFSPWFEISQHKKAEADKLLAEIRKHRGNYIVCGDFNAEPDSYPIKEISKTLVSAGPPNRQKTFTTIPFSYKGMEATGLDWRIDYIFTTPDIKVLRSRILKTGYSDHLPILAEIIV